MKTGDLPRHEKVNQPVRHFIEAEELNNLLIENGFDTILQIEIETYQKPTMVDNGEFLLARGIKNK